MKKSTQPQILFLPIINVSTYIESKPYLHEIGKRAYTSSTLKIPRELLDYLYMREAAFGSRRDYFSHLIRTYGRYLGRFGFDKFAFKWKKAYQAQGQDLKRADFVPNPADWEELRHLAFAYGLSMCYLFVEILRLEKRRWEKAGKPEHFVEKPPKKSLVKGGRIRKKKWKRKNASYYFQSDKITKENLSNSPSTTGLDRQINRAELFLLRIGWMRE